MDSPALPDPRTPPPSGPAIPTGGGHGRRRQRRRRKSSTQRLPQPLASLDLATEVLLLFLVIFTPWAFGTTQAWSIWTANLAGYLVGAILVAKLVLRRIHEHTPTRWGDTFEVRDATGELTPPPQPRDALTMVLAALTVALLGYVLVSALNARAAFDPVLRQFDYLREPFRWLPHSYDRTATWAAFAQYLALACVFWGARDWLLQQTDDATPDEEAPRWTERQPRVLVPPRLRRLLWVLCLNATVLALVSTLQRADGTNKLLWILASRSNKAADNVFGPWSYRSNAAQYFNLIWPVCLGLWLWLQERAGRMALRPTGRFDGPHLLLLPAAMFVAAAPVVSSSRGGAFVCAGMGILCTAAILLLSRRKIAASARWITVGSLAGAAALGILAGWSSLKERLARPDQKFATGMEIGTNDFSLLVRTKVPTATEEWRRLAALGGSGRGSHQPGNLLLYLTDQGALLSQRLGQPITNHAILSTTNGLIRSIAGQSALFTFRRRNGQHQLLLDGRPLDTATRVRGVPTNWLQYVSARYLLVGDPLVTEAGLVDLALTDSELQHLAGQESLHSVTSIVHGSYSTTDSNPITAQAGVITDASQLRPTEGATVENARRATEPQASWIAVRRTEEAGPLEFSMPLQNGDSARFRGPTLVTATVWNPTDLPLRISAQIDGGMPADELIDPRSDTEIQLVCRPPHPGPLSNLSLRITTDNSADPTNVPGGTSVFVSRFQCRAAAKIITKQLTEEIRLLDLSDRMSGRNEYYENAQSMLADYPLWGTGAGAFASMYQLYMKPGQDWAAYLHNDWLETRITLGLMGFILVVTGLVVLLARSTLGRGLATPRVIVALFWIALAGCLAHARFDYPFQIYSVAFLFVLLASILTVLTARQRS